LVDIERSAKTFFPYHNFRPFQKEAIHFAYNVIENRKIGLLSSPCGTGKSISVLTAFFIAKEHDSPGKLFALTRTRNQLEIYCRELKKIKEHTGTNFVASMFKSKKEMCPIVKEDSRFKDLTYNDFLNYCRDLKDGVFGHVCEYYSRVFYGWRPSWHSMSTVQKIAEIGPLLPDEVYSLCLERTVCPYEITKILTRYADIVVGNYNYILVEPIRKALLGRAGISLNEVNCIFDEAHDLPSYIAGLLSDELSTRSIQRAMKEAENYKTEDFGLLKPLHKLLTEIGEKISKEHEVDAEHIIDRKLIINYLMKKLELSKTRHLIKLISNLSLEGEKIRWRKIEEGKNPISYTARCSAFLEKWVKLEGASYVNYAKSLKTPGEKTYVRIGIKCLDPALAASVLNDLRSTILMSGTLWDMNYYIHVLGIKEDKTVKISLPSPFPPENRMILVDQSVTTRYERRGVEEWKKIAENLEKILNVIEGRIAVYFPSYEMMNTISKQMKLLNPMLLESRETKVQDVFKFLKSNKKCVIFGVARGKVSEGVDMSIEGKSLLSGVIIVGLPYPKKTELQDALLNYFKERFGNKAFDYANDVPCANAVAQSAGRLLRSPEDRGIIILMDSRVTGRFKHKLPEEWKRDMEIYRKIEKLTKRIQEFNKKMAG
jgi:DNA excision repair protein ERCC-2